MKSLLFATLACTFFIPSVLSWTSPNRCNVGNTSGCSLQPVVEYNACFTCDSGYEVEASSCAMVPLGSTQVFCHDVRPKCEAEGGVFTWCYGDSCNSCNPRYQSLSLAAWIDKSVAFITAHPDDLEALAGATVAALTKQVGSSGCDGCAHLLTRYRALPSTSSS
jgi:hypothetical protein